MADHDPVAGVHDTTALAARLGVPDSTVRAWLARSDERLERPAGRLTGMVWTEEQVERMAASITAPLKQGRRRTHRSRA